MKYLIGFLIACVLWLVALHNVSIPEYRVYDCRLAEIHPDFPAEVREECRRKTLEERRLDREGKIQTGIHEYSKSVCQFKSCPTT